MAKARAERPMSLSERLAMKPGKLKETWFSKLPTDYQENLLKLRADFHAGKFPAWSIRAVYEWVTDEAEQGDMAIRVGKSAFQTWMQEAKND